MSDFKLYLELKDVTHSIQILDKKDLERIFPIGKTKLNELLLSNVLPVVKIGRDYFTTEEMLRKWFEENSGKEIEY